MIYGNELDGQVYESEHIAQVLKEINSKFPAYFKTFDKNDLPDRLHNAIEAHQKEKVLYEEYLDEQNLEEYEEDPNVFKHDTRTKCPIIHRCLMSQDEVMKDYKRSFNMVSGRDLLDTVRKIAEYGRDYASEFKHRKHERIQSYDELDIEDLKDEDYSCIGVIGYGIQSCLLYALYPQAFAYRSQNAVWALYFLTSRKDFGLVDGSEFLMIKPDYGTCEQNYFYPPELFGFYALKVYLLLKEACEVKNIILEDCYRYIYLQLFFEHVAEKHREDIDCLKWSSDDVENRGWH